VSARGAGPQRSADIRLGRAIRALRREQGLTLVRLARSTGLSQPFLSQLELGRTRPSMRSLFRIAEALGTTQQALLGLAEAGPVPAEAAGDGGGARLLHHGDHADVTEFALVETPFTEYYVHDRTEFLYVVRGSVELDVDGTVTALGPRACISYPGRTPHRFRAAAGEAVVLVVHTGEAGRA
jgi:transcriptional regulator with XRE-family HTH domain